MPKPFSEESEHDEVLSLLPWYVNRSLESSQRARVSSHVERCELCQSEVQLLGSLHENAQGDAPSGGRDDGKLNRNLAEVMSRIDSEGQPGRQPASMTSRLRRTFMEWFSSPDSLPFTQWAATAAAGLLVVVLGYQWLYPGAADDYSVLSSSEAVDASLRVAVELVSEEHWPEVQASIEREFEKQNIVVNFNKAPDDTHLIIVDHSIDLGTLTDIVVGLQSLDHIKQISLQP